MSAQPESLGGRFAPTCPLRVEHIDEDYIYLNQAEIAIRTECIEGCKGAIEVPYVAKSRLFGIGPFRDQVCFTQACPEEIPSE